MSERLTRVAFEPLGKFIKARPGTNLLDLIRKLDLNFPLTCGGKGKCGKCKVKIEAGIEGLNPPADTELEHLSPQQLEQGYRLACQISIPQVPLFTIRVPQVTEVAELKLQVEGALVSVFPDPMVKKYLITVPEDGRSDEDKLLHHLKEEHDLDCHLDYEALKMLPLAVGKGKGLVTCVVYGDNLVTAVEPRDTTPNCLGLAVDIGTTKLACFLMDLNSGKELASSASANPQTIYGEDVMSRIAFSMDSKANLLVLQRVVLVGINSLIADCCAKAGLSPRWIYEGCFVGNPCMMHLLLGLPPKSLAFFPYQPAFRSGIILKAAEMPFRLKMHPGARLYTLPLVAGFVGADNIAVQLAAGEPESPRVKLLLDIGANTELVLSDSKSSLACSCASGPAFEGMHITYGRKADSASIEKVWINPETLEVNFKTIGGMKPAGICGSGVIHAIAEMLKAGILHSNGKINGHLTDKTARIREGDSGELEFVIAWKDETAIGCDITITQQDVREIQKAKAAVHAGCTLLMRRKGIVEGEIEDLIIAGAFGYYLDKEGAQVIGMFPEVRLGRIKEVGNAAGTGAKLALISRLKRQEAEHISKTTGYYELALDSKFIEEYARSMLFPTSRSSGVHPSYNYV